MNKGLRSLPRPSVRSLGDWPSAGSRSEAGWDRQPCCPLLGEVAPNGFLRDRLHLSLGTPALPGELTDTAVNAALRLMIRRGF
jgi:hypothetical protein